MIHTTKTMKFINDRCDFEIELTRTEIAKYADSITGLQLGISVLNGLITSFDSLIANIEDILARYGSLFSPVFIDNLNSQISRAQESITEALLDITQHEVAIELNQKAIEELLAFIVGLDKLKKKVDEASGIVFLDENKKEITHMFLKVNQSLPLSISIKDKFGNEAKVDGAPSWALSDPSLGALTVAEGGMSASLAPAGTVGAFKVQVSADADLGEGVKSILGELDIELLAGDAEVLSISAGEPV